METSIQIRSNVGRNNLRSCSWSYTNKGAGL